MIEAIYEKIGPSGAVLACFPFLSLYFFLASILYLAWIPRRFRQFVSVLKQSVPSVTEDQARTNPMCSILWDVLAHKTPRNELQSEVQYLFQRHLGRTHTALTILRLISVLSPLLGLMGTVLGISRVFHEISFQSAVDNSVLAGGIWEALITTIMGLSIAIPTLVAYYLLRLRVRSLMIECIESARDLMR